MGQERNGTGEQWDWGSVGRGNYGTGAQWDEGTMGPGRSGTREQWDWVAMGRGNNGTGARFDQGAKERPRTHAVRESALKVDYGRGKKSLPHRGIEPAPAACRSDTLPTKLHPLPLFRVGSPVIIIMIRAVSPCVYVYYSYDQHGLLGFLEQRLFNFSAFGLSKSRRSSRRREGMRRSVYTRQGESTVMCVCVLWDVFAFIQSIMRVFQAERYDCLENVDFFPCKNMQC